MWTSLLIPFAQEKQAMHQKKSGRLWFLTALMASAMLLIGVSLRSDWLAPSHQPILRFAYDRFPGSLPPLLAEKLGYFQNGSCAVELVLDNEHPKTNGLFAAGYYSGMATPLASIVASSSTIPEQRIVYIKDDSRGVDVLLAESSISKLNDLQGKRVGVLIGDFGEFWLDSLLSTVGLDIHDVEIIPSRGNDIPQLIANGEVHAGHTWTPFFEEGVKQGQKVLASTAKKEFVIVDAVVFRKEIIASHRACVKEFLSAWSKAVKYWRVYPQESANLLAQALGQDPAGLSLAGIKLFDREENLKTMNSPELLATLDAYAQFFKKRGVTVPKNLNSQLLDPTLIRELREEEP